MNSSENFEHTSVLLPETIDSLNIKPTGIYMDGTVGGAGHSKAILEQLSSGAKLLCFDKDMDAVQTAEERLSTVETDSEFKVIHADYLNFAEHLPELGIDKIDGVLLDLGVSSWQLDEAERGFSYMQSGPLDMRMDQSSGITAAEVIAEASSEELADIFYKYGEENNSRRIARAIVKYRDEEGPIVDTKQLSDIIVKAQPAKSRRQNKHPAKRCFQALRIYVNSELVNLDRFLQEVIDYLSEGARVSIISFHSLEDRIVKQTFRKWEDPCECPKNLPCTCGKKSLGKAVPRNGIVPTKEEKNINPRSKSARLRTFERNQQEKNFDL